MKLDKRIYVVVGCNCISVAARMSLVSFLAIYFSQTIGIALPLIGIAFLAENVLRGVLAPFYGALSDRIGRRPLLIASTLAMAVLLPSFLLVRDAASLLVWSLAMGVAGGVHIPVGIAFLLDLVPRDRRQYMLAVNYTGLSVGYALGVMPAGFIAAQGYGLLAALSSAGFIVIALMYLFVLRSVPRREMAQEGVSLFMHAVSAGKDRVFVVFASLAFIFPLAMGLIVFVSPVFATDLGLSTSFIGVVLGANNLIVVMLAVPLVRYTETFKPFHVLGLAGLFVGSTFACFAFIPQPEHAIIAGALLFSFGEALFSSAVPAAVASLSPAGRHGAYQGAWSMVQSFSMGGALFVSGLLRDTMGWRLAWFIYAGLALLAGAVLFKAGDWFSHASKRRGAASKVLPDISP